MCTKYITICVIIYSL